MNKKNQCGKGNLIMIGLNNLTTNSLSFIEGQNNHLEEVCVKLGFIDYDMPNEKDKKERKEGKGPSPDPGPETAS